MDEARREHLVTIMTDAARGDRATVMALYTYFGDEIRATLHALDLEFHTRVLRRLEGGDVDAIVVEACFELEAVAGGWRPDGGALPWTWARMRLVALLRRHTTTGRALTTSILESVAAADPPPARSAVDQRPSVVLRRLARRDAGAALLDRAFDRVVPEADRDLLLAHAEQVAEGGPSPAITVAGLVGRTPAAVRKSVERNRRRLAHLARTQREFRPLLGLPLLGPAGGDDHDGMAA